MSAAAEPSLADLGETGILRALFPRLARAGHGAEVLLGPGDDAALVRAADGRVLVSTDLLSEGLDFRRDWSTGRDVGVKAAAQNLADIAAMGGTAHSLVVALVAPSATPLSWVLDLADGLVEGCREVGAVVVGGDLSGGDSLCVSVTVLGGLAGADPVRRDGARVGDVVAHAGVLGHSGAGLALLSAGHGTAGEPADVEHPLVAAHRRPRPPLAAGPAANLAGATAMIDLSDGLLRDAGRIATASGVDLELDAGAGSVLDEAQEGLAPVAALLGSGPRSAWDWVLAGGEDHGLLACFPPDVTLPDPFRRIGQVVAGPGRVLVPQVDLGSSPGWDHYRT